MPLTDLGTNRYVQVNNDWYYIGSNRNHSQGATTIDGVDVYFDKTTGKQVKGKFVTESGFENDGFTYDKDNGASLNNNTLIIMIIGTMLIWNH